MKDEARIISNTLVTYGAKLVTGTMGFVMVPYLMGRLGQETYGIMGICSSFLGLLLIVEAGVRPGLTRQFTDALARGEVAHSNEIAASALGFYLALSLAIAVPLALGGSSFLSTMNVPAGRESEAAKTLLLVGATASLGLVAVPFVTVLQSQLRHDIEQYLAAGTSLCTGLLIVLLFELRGPRLVTWATVQVAAALVVLIVYVRKAHRLCPTLEVRARSASWRAFGEIAGFSVYTTLLGTTGWVNMQSGPMVISYFLGTAAVSHYVPVLAIVATLMPLHAAFLAPLRTFLTRAHATGDWDVIRRVLIRSTRYSLLITGGIVVLLASIASQGVPLWLGHGFEDTTRVLVLWCVAWVLQASTGAAYGIYVGTGRLRAMTLLTLALALSSLALGVALVKWTSLGIVGVAGGMIATESARAVAYFFYSTYLCGVARRQYLREAFLGPALCLGGLLGASLAVQHFLATSPVLEVLLAAGSGALVYAPLVWLVGLTEADRVKALGYLTQLRTLGRRRRGQGARSEI